MDAEAEVRELVAEEFGLSGGIEMSTRLADLALPDVNRITDLLVILEDRFGCQFETREIDRIVTVGDLAECLGRKACVVKRPGFW